MLRTVFVLLLLGRFVPAQAQSEPQDVRALLFGDSAVRPRVLKDLGSGWYAFHAFAPKAETKGSGGLFGGGEGGEVEYFTQGRTLSLNGATFLVAYRVTPRPLDFTKLMQTGQNQKEPDMSAIMALLLPKRTPDSPLSLTLLDTREIGQMQEFHAFDLTRELAEMDASTLSSKMAIEAAILFPVFAQARLKARQTSSLSNLKQIALGVLMYAQDHDEVLPPMKDAATAKKAIFPYVKSDAIFLSPHNKAPYVFNIALSRRSLASLAEPASTVLAYEAAPTADRRAVAFVDGHAKLIPESDWPRLKKKSGIP